MDTYQVAMYLRLSKEALQTKRMIQTNPYGKRHESGSISMQKMLLEKYAAENFTDYQLITFCEM